jgi:hypothetical protein
MFDYTAGRGVLKVALAELLIPADTSAPPLHANLIEFPPEYREHRALWGFTPVSVAPVPGRNILVGFAAAPYLVRYRLDGTPLDTLTVPVTARRGHPPGWLERFSDGRALTLQEEVEAFSYLNAIWQRSDGSYLLWYQQNTINPEGPNPPYFGKAFITVLSADLREACVDAEVAFPGTDWPNMGMHGDTLLALDLTADVGDSTVQAVVRRYLVGTDDCDWLPVTRRGADR